MILARNNIKRGMKLATAIPTRQPDLYLMNQTSTGKTDLPLIRLSLVSPFIDELERRDIDCRIVLAEFDSVKEDIFQGDMFVAAPVMYGLVEKLSAASGDPYFGVRNRRRFAVVEKSGTNHVRMTPEKL
jgi:hypothetical protein